MIELEKNFIGKICETCHELSPNVIKIRAKDGNIVISVCCDHGNICHNALMQAAAVKLKEEDNGYDKRSY